MNKELDPFFSGSNFRNVKGGKRGGVPPIHAGGGDLKFTNELRQRLPIKAEGHGPLVWLADSGNLRAKVKEDFGWGCFGLLAKSSRGFDGPMRWCKTREQASLSLCLVGGWIGGLDFRGLTSPFSYTKQREPEIQRPHPPGIAAPDLDGLQTRYPSLLVCFGTLSIPANTATGQHKGCHSAPKPLCTYG